MAWTCHPPALSVPYEVPPLPVDPPQILPQLLSKPVPYRLAYVGLTALDTLGHLVPARRAEEVLLLASKDGGLGHLETHRTLQF